AGGAAGRAARRRRGAAAAVGQVPAAAAAGARLPVRARRRGLPQARRQLAHRGRQGGRGGAGARTRGTAGPDAERSGGAAAGEALVALGASLLLAVLLQQDPAAPFAQRTAANSALPVVSADRKAISCHDAL